MGNAKFFMIALATTGLLCAGSGYAADSGRSADAVPQSRSSGAKKAGAVLDPACRPETARGSVNGIAGGNKVQAGCGQQGAIVPVRNLADAGSGGQRNPFIWLLALLGLGGVAAFAAGGGSDSPG